MGGVVQRVVVQGSTSENLWGQGHKRGAGGSWFRAARVDVCGGTLVPSSANLGPFWMRSQCTLSA